MLYFEHPENHLEAIAEIRNSVRHYMTWDQSVVDPKKQWRWYKSLNPNENRLYACVLDDECVGYGMITLRHGCFWLTGAIKPNYHGMGFGKALFHHLIQQCKRWDPSKEIWLDVWEWNDRAVKLYIKLGFELMGSAKRGVLRMKLMEENEKV